MADVRYFAFLIGYLTLVSALISMIVVTETGANINSFYFSDNLMNTSVDFTQLGDDATFPEGDAASGSWYIDSNGLRADGLNVFNDADYYFKGMQSDQNGYINNQYVIENSYHGSFGIWLYSDPSRQLLAEFTPEGVQLHEINRLSILNIQVLPFDKIIARGGYNYLPAESLTITTGLNTETGRITVTVDGGTVINTAYDPEKDWWQGVSYTTGYYGGVRSHVVGLVVKKFASSEMMNTIPEWMEGEENTNLMNWIGFIRGIMACLTWGITDPVLLSIVPFPILMFFIGIPEAALAFTVVQLIRGN